MVACRYEYDANNDFEMVDNNDYSSYAQWFAEDMASATDVEGAEVGRSIAPVLGRSIHSLLAMSRFCTGVRSLPQRTRYWFTQSDGVVSVAVDGWQGGQVDAPTAPGGGGGGGGGDFNTSLNSTGSIDHDLDYGGYYDNNYYVRHCIPHRTTPHHTTHNMYTRAHVATCTSHCCFCGGTSPPCLLR